MKFVIYAVFSILINFFHLILAAGEIFLRKKRTVYSMTNSYYSIHSKYITTIFVIYPVLCVLINYFHFILGAGEVFLKKKEKLFHISSIFCITLTAHTIANLSFVITGNSREVQRGFVVYKSHRLHK